MVALRSRRGLSHKREEATYPRRRAEQRKCAVSCDLNGAVVGEIPLATTREAQRLAKSEQTPDVWTHTELTSRGARCGRASRAGPSSHSSVIVQRVMRRFWRR